MLIVEHRESIQVYVNSVLQVTIRHPDVEDAIIGIHPDDVEQVIEALRKAAKEAIESRQESGFVLDDLYAEKPTTE